MQSERSPREHPAHDAGATLRASLPAEMLTARRWLVWKSVPSKGGAKPRKIPYYSCGKPRQGRLDTDADRSLLTSFDDALKTWKSGGYAGLGFALGPDDHGQYWQGVDLDETDERTELAAIVERLPGYVERSPSGAGWHSIGRGRKFAALGSNTSGIEAYAGARYFTVTGNDARGTLTDIADFVERVLAPMHSKTARPTSMGGGASLPGSPGEGFFPKVNAKALAALAAWVPTLFPKAKPYHDGFRVTSRDLGRNLQEDLSILPEGIKDFGEEVGKTPIDLVIQWGGAKDAVDAARWLCAQLGIDPAQLGWIDRGARAERREPPPPDREPRAGTSREYPWPSPSDISSPADAQPYPVHALPDVARAAVQEYAAFGQQPLPIIASSCLGQIALAAQPLADVARNDHLRSPMSLFLLAIAQSGERKSAADKVFGRAFRAWVQREREEREPEVRKSMAMAKDHKARIAGVESRIKTLAGKHDDEEAQKELETLRERLIDLEQHPIVAKPLPARPLEDVNAASLMDAVANGWPSTGLFSDEAGTVIGSAGLADDKATGLLSLLNILWDGRDFEPTRKVADVAEVRGRRFSAFLMMQPSLLAPLVEKGARNLGFLARFLISHPDSTMGTRLYREPPERWRALDDFDRAITRLLEHELPIDASGEDRGARMILSPPLMRLDPAAKRAWIEFHDAIERELAQFGEFEAVRDVASKSAENAVRLAGLLQIFDRGEVSRFIECPSMESGIAIAAWHLSEARRLFLELDAPEPVKNARELASWLVGKGRELANRSGEPVIDREGVVAPRDISRLGPNRLRDTTRRDEAIDILVEAHHLRRLERAGKKLLQVNPRLLNPG